MFDQIQQSNPKTSHSFSVNYIGSTELISSTCWKVASDANVHFAHFHQLIVANNVNNDEADIHLIFHKLLLEQEHFGISGCVGGTMSSSRVCCVLS